MCSKDFYEEKDVEAKAKMSTFAQDVPWKWTRKALKIWNEISELEKEVVSEQGKMIVEQQKRSQTKKTKINFLFDLTNNVNLS